MGKKQDIKINFNATTIAFWISLAGGAMLLATAFDWKSNAPWYLIMLYNILSCLGTTLLSVGLVSILVELSTIKTIVNKAIRSVYNDDIPLDQYSDSHLKKLKNKISAHLLSVSINKLQKTIYHLEPHLLQLTKNLYYEYHRMNCDIYPNDKDGTFTKRIKIEYKIINEHELDNCVYFGLSLYNLKENMTKKEKIDAVTIKNFKVNNINLLNDQTIDKNIIPTDVEDDYEYDYTFCFKRPLQKCKEHIVQLEYEYTTVQSDLTQSWKLKYPCKKTEHTITIKGRNNWVLKANAFASFYHVDSHLVDCFKTEQTTDKSAKIDFGEWTIPGAGYVISYNKSSY